MAIKKAVTEVKVKKAPQIVDDEVYLRLDIPGGCGLMTDGSQPETCSPIEYESVPHNYNEAKVGKVMGEYKRGKLHSGSKRGPKVKSRKQAVAIALNEARRG